MKIYSCSRIGRLNIKMSVLPNLIYRYNAVPIIIPESYFVDINKCILRFKWRGMPCGIVHMIGFMCRSENRRTANTTLKKNKAGDLHYLSQDLL